MKLTRLPLAITLPAILSAAMEEGWLLWAWGEEEGGGMEEEGGGGGTLEEDGGSWWALVRLSIPKDWRGGIGLLDRETNCFLGAIVGEKQIKRRGEEIEGWKGPLGAYLECTDGLG